MADGCEKSGWGGRRGAAPAHYALPSDLPGSLRRLDDGQFDRLLEAVIEEARRRGRRTGGVQSGLPASATDKPAGQGPASGGRPKKRQPLPLAPGQARLIRAAFEAGVKPAAIARQLRVSRTQVQQVLRGSPPGWHI